VTAAVAVAAFATAAAMGDDRAPMTRADRGAVLAWRSWLAHMRAAIAEVRASGRLAWIIGYSAVVFVLLRATVYLYQPLLDRAHFDYAQIGLVYAGVYLAASAVAHRGHALRERSATSRSCGRCSAASAVVRLDGRAARRLGPGLARRAGGGQRPLLAAGEAAAQPRDHRLGRRATILSVESIVRRGAMGVFSPIAGLYGADSAMQLCGVIGFVGMAVLAAVALRRVTWRGAPTP
jgi:hypothetical protein